MPTLLHPRYPMPEEALAMAELLGMAFTMQFSERGWHLVDLQDAEHLRRTARGVVGRPDPETVIEVQYSFANQEYLWREAINYLLDQRRKAREE